ncbi:MAG: arsenical pump rane protein [Actinomycetota bacterium]|nr:arsenical pump rane protein [Actinomycetota bacterium]
MKATPTYGSDVWLVAAALGLLSVATGLLPLHDAGDVTMRVAPVLAFLVAVTVLAELADAAEVFDVAAARAARIARGRVWLLYGCVLVLGAVTTVVLSLDTTAVLFTPVALSLAAQLELDPLPFAFAAVWLANTASLLLPVSNLTNLLAVDRLDLTPWQYVQHMALPAAAALAVTAAALALWHRRRLRGHYVVPEPRVPRDRALFTIGVLASAVLAPLLLLGVAVAVAAGVSAAALVVAFAVRRRSALRWRLVPWRLVLLVEGLFLVVSAIGPHGLDDAIRSAAGTGGGLRLAGAAAVGANLANNLPAYLALERVVPHGHLLDVLLGVNLGPLVLPWGSLATLLWMDRCRARGVHVSARQFALAGLLVVPPLLLVAGLALRV